MRAPVWSGQFKRDLKAARKRGKDMEKIKALMRLLIDEKPLSPQYKDHPLKGRWRSFRDAHIESDWLLIYKIDGDEVRFERTGRHHRPVRRVNRAMGYTADMVVPKQQP